MMAVVTHVVLKPLIESKQKNVIMIWLMMLRRVNLDSMGFGQLRTKLKQKQIIRDDGSEWWSTRRSHHMLYLTLSNYVFNIIHVHEARGMTACQYVYCSINSTILVIMFTHVPYLPFTTTLFSSRLSHTYPGAGGKLYHLMKTA